MNGLFPKLALISLVGLAGCANSTASSQRPRTKFDRVQFSATIGGLLFFDQDTGNIWLYQWDPQKPAILLSRLDALGKPMLDQHPPTNPAVAETAAPTPPAKTLAAPLQPNATKLVAYFNSLPKELWPTENETAAVYQARESWLRDNKRPDSDSITGVVDDVSTSYDRPQKPDGSDDSRPVINMSVDGGTVVIWGRKVSLHVGAALDLTLEDGLKWKKGQPIHLTGKVSSAVPDFPMFGAAGDLKLSVGIADAKVTH